MTRVAVLVVAAVSAACGFAKPPDIPTLTVGRGTFEARVTGRGELRAEKSTPVIVPAELRGRQILAWTLEDGAKVRAGETVARLDDAEILRQERDSRNKVEKVDHQLTGAQASQRQERRGLDGEIAMTRLERDMVGRFASKDPLVFSRNEIIDAEVDLEFLDFKNGILQSRHRRQDRRHAADVQLLGLQRGTHALRMKQVQEMRGRMALVAPHDGVFLAGRTWEGERIEVGSQLWSGQEIGSLPDLSRMEVLVRVLESEMSGVTVGVPATVVLDAQPGVEHPGKVTSVAAVAAPIERDSPVKYFDVVVSLDATVGESTRPGLRARVSLHVKRQDDVLAIPNQAIFRKGEDTWVFVRDGRGFARRAVTLGERSPTRTVVTTGLAAGDAIALGDVEGAL